MTLPLDRNAFRTWKREIATVSPRPAFDAVGAWARETAAATAAAARITWAQIERFGEARLPTGEPVSAAVPPVSAHPIPNEEARMEPSLWTMPIAQAAALHNAAYFALIAGAVVVAVATMTLFWTTGIRERYASARVAEAEARSVEAHAEIARANAKAAALTLEAQQARVEQERIKGQLAWRRISPDQHKTIVHALRGHPMEVLLLAYGNDPEAQQYAGDIQKTLEDAGSTVSYSIGIFATPIKGLGMSLATSPEGSVLYAALRSAGLEIGDIPKRDKIMIVVGGKPPAF